MRNLVANGVDLVRAVVDEGLRQLARVVAGAADDRHPSPHRAPGGRADAARPPLGLSR
ncbi:hypothetical protein [Trujillonella humicola]|uniref:hypothetical protein n=1 Tax=Trujillonella humicola TaxID=3383699 RepID=UPI003906C55B